MADDLNNHLPTSTAADGRDMLSSAGFSVNESFAADPGFGTMAADFEQATAIRFGTTADNQVRKVCGIVNNFSLGQISIFCSFSQFNNKFKSQIGCCVKFRLFSQFKRQMVGSADQINLLNHEKIYF